MNALPFVRFVLRTWLCLQCELQQEWECGYRYYYVAIRMSTKYSISPAIGLAKQSVIDVEFSSIVSPVVCFQW